MMFLLDYGYSNDDINEIIHHNAESIIKNIELNKNNVCKVIDYLKEIGVTMPVIKELFIYQIGMFFRTKDEIQTVFDEYEIESIIKSLNYDVNTVDLIEFS